MEKENRRSWYKPSLPDQEPAWPESDKPTNEWKDKTIPLKKRKALILDKIQEQRKLIEEFDKKYCAQAKDSDQTTSLETQVYASLTRTLNEHKEHLQQLHLEGDEFEVIVNKDKRILEISPQSQLIFYSFQLSEEPKIPPSTDGIMDFKTVIAEENGKQLFQLRITDQVFYIHELKLIAPQKAKKKDRPRKYFVESHMEKWEIPRVSHQRRKHCTRSHWCSFKTIQPQQDQTCKQGQILLWTNKSYF